MVACGLEHGEESQHQTNDLMGRVGAREGGSQGERYFDCGPHVLEDPGKEQPVGGNDHHGILRRYISTHTQHGIASQKYSACTV